MIRLAVALLLFAHPGHVTRHEYNSVYVGETQTQVERAFGTEGQMTRAWATSDGAWHFIKHYHAETGRETWIKVEYSRVRLGAPWLLDYERWCVRADMQAGTVCHVRAYP